MSFETLGLSTEIQRAIKEQGYAVPTPIQLKAIPVVLCGKDVMAGAQTGTGKTAGFTLPLLHRLSKEPISAVASSTYTSNTHASNTHTSNNKGKKARAIRALIITPTRELSAQIQQSIETYGRYLPLESMVVFGGVKINPQIDKLRSGVDILVATPGRLLDHVSQGTLSLSNVEILVLDEADRMLDMGFIHDIRKIMALLPETEKRQNLLFSATFSKEIKQLASRMLNDPQLIEVAPQNATADRIEQSVYTVDKSRKRALLTHLISTNNWQQVLVFTRTKHGANRLTQQLDKAGISAAAIHGNKSQGARTKALAGFKSNDVRILVATDIAARGLDIDQLPHVVNYELPNVPEDYVHRIGRTARAGNAGEAVSLVDRSEQKLLRDIERLLKRELPRSVADGFEPGTGTDTDPDENDDQRRRTNHRAGAPERGRRNRGGANSHGAAAKKKVHGRAGSGAKRRSGRNSSSQRSSGNRV